jgi:hypothetical protein
VAWPVGPLPPAAGAQFTIYDWAQQFPDAIRELDALIAGNVGGFNSPASTRVHASGKVSSVEIDPDDATKLRIHCKVLDVDGVTWIDPDWIGNRVAGDAADKKWWTNYTVENDDFRYLPSFYKVALYKFHTCGSGDTSPKGSDPNAGHSLHIDDNGQTYLRVPNDGVLILNGQTLGDYTDFAFEILRAGVGGKWGAPQYGYSWIMRFPPRPNSTTYAWGYNCQVVTVAIAADVEQFTLTVAGQTTAPIPGNAEVRDVQAALELLSVVGDDNVVVQGGDGGFTLIFNSINVGDVAVTATPADGVTVTEPDNVIGDVEQVFGANLVGKEVILTTGIEWRRVAITAVDGHTLTFAGSGTEPNVNKYFTVVAAGGFWRPHFYTGIGGGGGGFPQFRVELIERITRSGLTKFWETGNYWCPAVWYATYALEYVKGHDPVNDAVIDYGIPAAFVTFSECVSELCNCDAYVPDGGKQDFDAFDVDLTSLPENFCDDDADLMFAPWMPGWTIRGWQLSLRNRVGAFVPPIDYTGEESITAFTLATWGRFHTPADSRSVTIGSVDGSGIAHFGAVTMPQRTPAEGNYTSLSKCFYELKNADGSTADAHTGTLAASTFTMDAHGTKEAPILGFSDPGDVGKTLVIWFSEERRHERMLRYLYERIGFEPDENEDGPVMPPVEEYPGAWSFSATPSTTACEFDERGRLQDVGQEFVANQAYRYMADVFDGPTGRDGLEDILYQGIPSPTSDFPRFGKSGKVTAGGNGFLQDDTKVWWVSGAPMVTHIFDATAGSTAATIKDSAAYKLWTTHVTIDGEATTELQLRLSRFWQRGFVGMIAKGRVGGTGTPEDPYVWERRPIVSMNVTDPTNPSFTVAPPFSVSMTGKHVEIDEPGASDRGAILQTFKGRKLKITHANGAIDKVPITHSDDSFLYWATSENVTAAAGDTYEIEEFEPGSIVHYEPTAAENDKHGAGFVRPHLAAADTRVGRGWYTEPVAGIDPMLLNCGTIVKAYGLHRKRDVLDNVIWLQWYRGNNVLWLMRKSPTWTNNGEVNRWAGGPWDSFDGSDSWSDVKGFIDDQYTADAGLSVDGARPHAFSFGSTGTNWTGTFLQKLYAYGKLTGLNTCFASSKIFLAKCAVISSGQPVGHYAGGLFGAENHTDIAFDGGSNGLLLDQWKSWYTSPPNRDGTYITSTPVGSGKSPSPTWCDQPQMTLDVHGKPVDKYLGHVVSAEAALLNFNVPGGRRYLGS